MKKNGKKFVCCLKASPYHIINWILITNKTNIRRIKWKVFHDISIHLSILFWYLFHLISCLHINFVEGTGRNIFFVNLLLFQHNTNKNIKKHRKEEGKNKGNFFFAFIVRKFTKCVYFWLNIFLYGKWVDQNYVDEE